jgi:hypothetical protein
MVLTGGLDWHLFEPVATRRRVSWIWIVGSPSVPDEIRVST